MSRISAPVMQKPLSPIVGVPTMPAARPRPKEKPVCKKLLSVLALVAATILSSACVTERVRYVQVPLLLPDRPELPRISSDELQCLGAPAYIDLVRRDVLQETHIDRLEAIINTTHYLEPFVIENTQESD